MLRIVTRISSDSHDALELHQPLTKPCTAFRHMYSTSILESFFFPHCLFGVLLLTCYHTHTHTHNKYVQQEKKESSCSCGVNLPLLFHPCCCIFDSKKLLTDLLSFSLTLYLTHTPTCPELFLTHLWLKSASHLSCFTVLIYHSPRCSITTALPLNVRCSSYRCITHTHTLSLSNPQYTYISASYACYFFFLSLIYISTVIELN